MNGCSDENHLHRPAGPGAIELDEAAAAAAAAPGWVAGPGIPAHRHTKHTPLARTRPWLRLGPVPGPVGLSLVTHGGTVRVRRPSED